MSAWWSVLSPLVLAFAVSVLLTPLMRRVATRLKFFAHPARDRWHSEPIPLLGGAAIAGAVLCALLVTGAWEASWVLLPTCGLMLVLGTTDDISHVGPAPKLVGHMLVAALLVFLAPPVSLTGITLVDQLLVFAWIIGITNAFNLLDNIDGLSAGIAAIAGAFYLAVLVPGESPIAPAIAALVGAAGGFLVYNFRPASIFMGDGGSFLLGSFLAGATLLATPDLKTELVPVATIPLLVLLVPIFDTLFVTLMRGLKGRRVWIGGRDHISHRLVALGIDDRRAVLTLYALAILGGVVALAVQHVDLWYALVLVALYLTMVVGLGVFLGHVETNQEINGATAAIPRPLVSELTYRYRVYEILLDTVLVGVAYYTALRLRFGEPEFLLFLPHFVTSFPIVVACQLGALSWFGKYRHRWSTFGSTELLAILKGVVAGLAASVVLLLYLYRFVGFSRWVFVIDGATVLFLLIGARLVIVRVDEFLRRRRADGRDVLIYGAGCGGTLLVRELLQNSELGRAPFGFIDDDPLKRRLKIEGVPVLGSLVELPAILDTRPITELIVAIRDLPTEQLASARTLCSEYRVGLRRMSFELSAVDAAPATTPHGPTPH